MSAPTTPVVRDCADVRSPEDLDPTPVDDLEVWHAGYDPQAAGELERLLEDSFGPAGTS